MATTIVSKLMEKYPKAKFQLSTNFPVLFQHISLAMSDQLSFPVLYLTYGHYDLFPWKNQKPIHYAEMMARLVDVSIHTRQAWNVRIDEQDHLDFVEKWCRHEKYIVVQAESSHWFKEKDWSIAKWQNLVSILNDHGFTIYLIGSIENSAVEGAIDLRGKTTLSESLLLIKYAKLLLGINSFAEQAAHLYGTPAVILYGPTNPQCSLNPNQLAVFGKRIVPYEELGALKYDFPTMKEITVKTVFEAANYALIDDLQA